MVAAAKLGKVQQQVLQMRPYAEKLTSLLNNVMASTQHAPTQRYAAKRPVKKLLLVVMTSDRGLCGAFNANVLKKALHYLQTWSSDLVPAQIDVLPIGKKASDFFAPREFNLIHDYVALSQHLDFNHASQVAAKLTNAFLQATYDQIVLVYNQFQSAATQVPCVLPFLPIPQAIAEAAQQGAHLSYIYEPSTSALMEALVPQSLQIQFYQALLESNASEHGARMTTMSKATDNAEELLKSLRLTYNRTRQGAITREIAEIVAGAEALVS